MSSNGLSRRHALTGAATIGVGVPLLAACGDDGATANDPGATPSSSDASSPASSPTPSSQGTSKAPAAGIAATSDVPVGGGLVVGDSEVVITQPTAGDFKCFTAICTHQGCLVGDVSDTINCPCHGSQFSIEDGSNVTGPSGTASGSVAPLAPVEISVEGDQISLA